MMDSQQFRPGPVLSVSNGGLASQPDGQTGVQSSAVANGPRARFSVFISRVFSGVTGFGLACTVLFSGCNKPDPMPVAGSVATNQAVSLTPPMDTVARIHWIGKKRVSADTNAASLIAIWNMPESGRLEKQTLDKLSLAPWRLLGRNLDTNTAALLRPLLDDIVQEESYLEIREATNQPGELAFAIHLEANRAGLWRTNLGAVLKSLTGIEVTATDNDQGWSLKKHHVPNLLELRRLGNWTVLGAGQDRNDLLSEFTARIQNDPDAFALGATNDWIEADLDLRRIAVALGFTWNLPQMWPEIVFDERGNRTNITMHANLRFPGNIPFEFEPWNIPTNLIDTPLVSLTAARGFKPWLASTAAWRQLNVGEPPNQVFCWALEGLQMQTYVAAPLKGASNEVSRISDLIINKGGPWFTSHNLTGFSRSESFNGLEWKGLPYVSPSLKSVSLDGSEFMFAELFPDIMTAPPGLGFSGTLVNQTNLVVYDWEQTRLRVDQWTYISQFVRFVSKRSQLPASCAGMSWLKAVAPKLGESRTLVTRESGNHFSCSRLSGVGFTAIELQVIVDWLESADWPKGFYSWSSSASGVDSAP